MKQLLLESMRLVVKVFHMHLSTMIIGPHLCYRNYPGSVSSAVTRVCYFRSCSALSTSHGIIGCKETILALVDQFISTNIVNNMCIVKNSIYVLNIHTNDQNLSCDSIASLFTASRHFPISSTSFLVNTCNMSCVLEKSKGNPTHGLQ